MELTSNQTAQVDAQSEEWFASYAEPSNRHRHGRRRRGRDPMRQRIHRFQRLNTIMMIASVVFVGAMTACFYVVLTR